jgi:hypothetical protein
VVQPGRVERASRSRRMQRMGPSLGAVRTLAGLATVDVLFLIKLA